MSPESLDVEVSSRKAGRLETTITALSSAIRLYLKVTRGNLLVGISMRFFGHDC